MIPRRFTWRSWFLSGFRLLLVRLFWRTEKWVRDLTLVPNKDNDDIFAATIDAFFKNSCQIHNYPIRDFVILCRTDNAWKVFNAEIYDIDTFGYRSNICAKTAQRYWDEYLKRCENEH